MTENVTRVTPDFDRDVTGYIGRKAIHRTYSGEALVGTIERFDGARAIIRFDDGRWAFSGYELELVDPEQCIGRRRSPDWRERKTVRCTNLARPGSRYCAVCEH